MHSRLTDHLLYKHVFEAGKHILSLVFLRRNFLLVRSLNLGLRVLLEHVMCDALVFLQEAADNILVVLSGVGELDDLGQLSVQMVLLHGVLFDGYFGVLQVADIDASGLSVRLEEVTKVLQFIVQIIGFLKIVKEVLLLVLYPLPRSSLLLLFLLLQFHQLAVRSSFPKDLLAPARLLIKKQIKNAICDLPLLRLSVDVNSLTGIWRNIGLGR